MPDEHGWFGPEDGWWRAKCNGCGEEFQFCITEGGGPAYHVCPERLVHNRSYDIHFKHRPTCYDTEVLGPVGNIDPKGNKGTKD